MRAAEHKKGQVSSPDFAASLALFLVIVVVSAMLWNATVLKYSQFRDNRFMQDKAFSVTDALIRTEGYPRDWNRSNVKLVGLSEGESHVLDPGKLIEFKSVANDTAKQSWGIGGYNYYVRITNSSGGIYVLDGTELEYGTLPAGEKDLVPIKRIVLVNDSGTVERATLTFMIWR